MADFHPYIITDNGRALIARVSANQGEELVFTKFEVSNSEIDIENNGQTIERLPNVNQSVNVDGVIYQPPDMAKVTGLVTSVGLTQGYYVKTIALWAKSSKDTSDILFAITTQKNYNRSDWMSAEGSQNSSSILISSNIIVANAKITSVTMTPDGTVSQEAFDNFRNTITAEITSHKQENVQDFEDVRNNITQASGKITEVDGKVGGLDTRVTVLEGKIADGIDAKNSIVLYEAGKTYKAGQLVYTIEEVTDAGGGENSPPSDKVIYEGAEVEVIDEWVQVPKNPKNKVLEYTITLTREPANMTKKTWSPTSNNDTNWDDSFFGIGRWGLPTNVWKVRQPGEIVFTLMDNSTYSIKGWFNNWRDEDNAINQGYYKYFYFVNTTRKVVPEPNLYLDYPEGHTRPEQNSGDNKEYGGFHKNDFVSIYYMSNGYGIVVAPDKVDIYQRQSKQLVKKMEIYTYEY